MMAKDYYGWIDYIDEGLAVYSWIDVDGTIKTYAHDASVGVVPTVKLQ